jgi:hypothetical protein
MRLNANLPAAIAAGASRGSDWGVDVTVTDGRHEVRNQRCSRPLRTYDVPFATMKSDDPDYRAVLALWNATEGGLHSFNHWDDEDEEWAEVRFEAPLRSSHVAGPWFKIDTVTLVEVR